MQEFQGTGEVAGGAGLRKGGALRQRADPERLPAAPHRRRPHRHLRRHLRLAKVLKFVTGLWTEHGSQCSANAATSTCRARVVRKKYNLPWNFAGFLEA